MGELGQLEKVDIKNGVQGGNSLYYTTVKDDLRIALPYGFGRPNSNEPPTYGDRVLKYMDHKSLDTIQLGLTLTQLSVHLDPFHPLLKAKLNV